MDSTTDKEIAAQTDPATEAASLRVEVAELRARIEGYERLLQMRDAVLTRAEPPSTPSVATAASPQALPAKFEIAADQLLPAQDGFYHLEWGPEGAFRWTGPMADIHFEAWLDRSSPLVAALRIFHFGTPANAKEMALEVDGALYPLSREGNEKLLRSAPIASRVGDGPTRLTLKVPHMHSPADRGLADKRILGIAFQRLSIGRG